MEPPRRRNYRWLALLLLLLFVGLIGYSTLHVRFEVSGQTMSEYQVLEGSLTHAVQRAPDGALIASQPSGEGAKACPT